MTCNVKLKFDDKALKAIANKGIKSATGQDCLIIENVLDTMFVIPDAPDIDEVIINEEVVQNNTTDIYKKKIKKAQSQKKKSKVIRKK